MQGQPVAPRTGMSPIQWVLIGLGVVLLICCLFAFTAGRGITNLFQGNAPPPSNLNPVRSSPVPQNPSGQSNPPAQNVGGVDLGQVVTARSVGAKNAPQDVTTTFSSSDRAIYVVAEGRQIPAGTSMFARWSRDGGPFEDTNQITADRSYQNTYVEFHIQPTSGNSFPPGNYAVQLFVNGNPGPQVSFVVR